MISTLPAEGGLENLPERTFQQLSLVQELARTAVREFTGSDTWDDCRIEFSPGDPTSTKFDLLIEVNRSLPKLVVACDVPVYKPNVHSSAVLRHPVLGDGKSVSALMVFRYSDGNIESQWLNGCCPLEVAPEDTVQ